MKVIRGIENAELTAAVYANEKFQFVFSCVVTRPSIEYMEVSDLHKFEKAKITRMPSKTILKTSVM